MLVALIIAYPIVVHLSLLWGRPVMAIMLLVAILAAAGLRALARASRSGRVFSR